MSTLDRLVAEKIMGWKLEKKNGWESWWERHELGKSKKYVVHDWKPSTDMNAAMEVVDKMSCTTKETWTLFYCSTGAVAQFHYEGGRDVPWNFGVHEGKHENMATAICLAALAAVGVEYKEATPESEVKRG